MSCTRFLLIPLMFLAVCSSAWGYLGDGSDRIEDLYGNLLQRRLRDDGTVSVLYRKGQYLYLVIFSNDRSVAETYSHAKGTDLSEKEIAKFLKLNGGGATWTAVDTSEGRCFKRSDNKAEATYGSATGRRALTVRDIGVNTHM